MAKRTNISDVYIGEDWYIPFFFKPIPGVSLAGQTLQFLLALTEESVSLFTRTISDGGIVVVSPTLWTGYVFVPRATTVSLTRQTYWWEFARIDTDHYKLYGFGEISLLYDT